METNPRSDIPKRPDLDEVRESLEPVAEQLVRLLCGASMGITEGQVMTPGPPPYRRLDCDARALCYIRVRPKKRGVRVDLSGLWFIAGSSRFRIPGSSGMASFMIHDPAHAFELAEYLRDVVHYTRHRYAEDRQRRRHA